MVSTNLLHEIDAEPTDAPMILVLGETGAGKSSFINTLAPGTVAIGHSLTSCTTYPQLIEARIDDRDVLLVDTPGFNDTYRSDVQILREIARTLTLQMQLGVKLRGVLYLHDISSARITGSSLRQLSLVQEICGEDTFENVVLVTTKWISTEPSGLQTGNPIREGDLRRRFWRSMIRQGSRMVRFDGRVETAKAIVRTLLEKEDIVLALQREILDERLSLEETKAGSFVVQARQDDEKKHSDLMAQMEASQYKDQLQEEIRLLRESLDQRKKDEVQLKEDIVASVETEVREKVASEFKKQGRRPTAVNIIGWLIGVTSMGIGILFSVLGGG